MLPFVLVDDVSDGLIRMLHAENVSGQSFNLIGDPMLTARDYFDAIHALLGAKMTVTSGSLNTLWLADGAKFLLNGMLWARPTPSGRRARTGFRVRILRVLTIADRKLHWAGSRKRTRAGFWTPL